jgi:hypothetical protein
MEVVTFELLSSEHEGPEEVSVIPFNADGKPVDHKLADQKFDDIDKAFKAAKKTWPQARWTNW